MNIIVLCGGLSAERDVSITSGRLAAGALRELGHRVVLMDLFFGYTYPYDRPEDIFYDNMPDAVGSIGEQAPDLESVRKLRPQNSDSRIGSNVVELCRCADIVFLALHGADGEDGKVQAMFDLEGIKYTGTGPLGSALAMNKGVAKQLFRENGIPTPEGITVNVHDEAYKNVGFPCVVKPRSGGSSVGTSVVFEEKDYLPALELAFRSEDNVIVERYIKGRECDVGVLFGKALPVIEICPKSGFYDYKNKYQAGGADEFCPADLPDEITEKLQKTAEAVFSALMLEVYARMDFIVAENGDVYCLEANTLPGMTPMSLLPQEAAAVGISYTQLCDKIIEGSLRKYEK